MSRIPIRLSSQQKYRNRKAVVDNITFDSAKEAKRYQELKILERSGEICDLELQPKFDLKVKGQLICRYVGDFRFSVYGQVFVEDVKGLKTREYRIKKKLMLAIHGIEIRET